MAKKETELIDEKRITYLQMIQDNISRMSTSSAVFKGFTSTIVVGVASLTFKDINLIVLILSFLPVILFAVLDIYYLQMERKFRILYSLVRTGKIKVNFDLSLPTGEKIKEMYDDEDLKKILPSKDARVISCIKSLSISCFYIPIIIICVIIIYMKIKGFI